MIEVEVKVYATHSFVKKNIELQKDKLPEILYSGTEIHKDQYFNNPDRDFTKTNEALRIRSIDGKAEITYKGPHMDDVSKTRKEFNSPADEYNMTHILLSLGYVLSGTVEKHRKIYTCDDMTICFDDVKNLGEFIEIEIDLNDTADEKEIKEATNKIFAFLSLLGIEKDKSIKESYLELMEKKEKIRFK